MMPVIMSFHNGTASFLMDWLQHQIERPITAIGLVSIVLCSTGIIIGGILLDVAFRIASSNAIVTVFQLNIMQYAN